MTCVGNRRPLPERPNIFVAVYANWDFDAAKKYLTLGGTGNWGPFCFGRGAEILHPHFALILNSPSEDDLTVTLPPERIWFAAGEPPEFKEYHRGQGHNTVLITCDASLARNPPTDREVILEPPVLQTWQVKRSLEELAGSSHNIKKTRSLSWVTSSKDVIPGHKLRLFFLRTLLGKVKIDLYGHGFNPIEDKWEGIAPYHYSIAFENSRSPYYFTEKIMDCFVCNTIPFYYGSPEIQKYFPAKSFIVIDPTDPSTPEKIRDIIASDPWRERQDALQEAKWLVL